ncbi:MAG: PBSX family phage terminase large subunit [Oscillibacter sp.]|nr:PBSX family phage terminase large subunit [Oscillibacter sp.]
MAKVIKRQTIPFVFGPEHMEYIQECRNCTFNILEGAVRAGKTIDNIFAFAHELRTTEDKIHLATGSTMANAKMNIGDANGFGLEYIFRGQCRWSRYKDNECLRIKGPSTGGRERIVIFSGGALSDSFKKIRGNSYGLWIATEINLHHDNTIKEAFNRQLAAKCRKIFWDLNPDTPGAPIYKNYLDPYSVKASKGELLGGYNYRHFTIFQNPTVSKERLAEILSQYQEGSLWYSRDILGLRIRPEGIVYPMFSRERHVIQEMPKSNPRHRYYVSVDFGTRNPFAAGLYDYDPFEKRAVMIRELYHTGGSVDRVDNEAYYRMLVKLIGDYPIQYIIIDPSASSMTETILKYGKYALVPADNDVLNGIQDVTRFLNAGVLLFHQSCEHVFEEFECYMWDEKKNDESVLKENDHHMDQIRYFCRTALRGEFNAIGGGGA